MSVRCHKDGKTVFVNPQRETVYFSVNSDGMSIEQYFNHVATYAYVDVDFYEIDEISVDQLRLFGVRESITKNVSRTTGEYYTGNPGRQPDWTTYGEFRWKLTLEVARSFGIYFKPSKVSGFNGKIKLYIPFLIE